MDNDVINLTKAIRNQESKGNYSLPGGSGEYGAYQWMPDTWNEHASEILGYTPKFGSQEMTPDVQNAVAYGMVKKWKDQGLNPAQIAAKWNSGSEVGWENKIGRNKQGVEYNVPQYVKSVTDYYGEYKKQGTPIIPSQSPEIASQSVQTKEPSLLSKAGKDIIGVGKSIYGRGEKIASDIYNPQITKKTIALETVGQTAGAFGDIVGGGLKLAGQSLYSGAKAIAPKATESYVSRVKKDINTIVNNPIGQKGLQALSKGVDAYKKWAELNPNASRDLESVVNIASVIPGSKAAQAGGETVAIGAKGAVKGAKLAGETAGTTKTLAQAGIKSVKEGTTLEKATEDIAKKNVEKVVKNKLNTALPVLKADIKKGFENKYKDATTAFTDIVKNGQRPTNFLETVEAQKNRMKQIYSDYTAKLGEADKMKFNALMRERLSGIQKDLQTQLQSTVLSDKKKALNQKIGEIQSVLKKPYTSPQDIQTYIEDLNNEAKSLYSATGQPSVKAIQSANIASQLRKVLDESIESTGGEGYQELRNVYKAHKTLESQLAAAAKKEANKTGSGLVDTLANAGATVEAIDFLLTHNPKSLLVAGSVKGISKLTKYLKSPNRALNNIFSTIEKEQKKVQNVKGLINKVEEAKNLPNQEGGFINPSEISKSVSGEKSLIEEAKKYTNSTEFFLYSRKGRELLREKGIKGEVAIKNWFDNNAKPKEKILDNLNPTGGIHVDYTPQERMNMKLGDNITTLDKTMGKSPDEIVTIYRGAPNSQKNINPGDFITTNYEIAKSYSGDGNVISKKVKLSDVLDDSTEPLGEEYIYRPKNKDYTKAKLK